MTCIEIQTASMSQSTFAAPDRSSRQPSGQSETEAGNYDCGRQEPAAANQVALVGYFNSSMWKGGIFWTYLAQNAVRS